MRASRDKPTAVLQALLVTFLWSTSWVLIKLGLKEIPALGFAGLRYFLAFLLLAGALLARPQQRAALKVLSRRDWLRLSLLGVVFYGLTQGAQFLGLALLPAVMLSLILSFSPVAVALLATVTLGERLTLRQWAGVLLFIAGALVYFLPKFQAARVPLSAIGLTIAGVGLLANSWGSILGRSINRSGALHPLLVTVVSMGVGSVVLLATGLVVEGIPTLDGSGWAIVGWLAVVNTALAFTLWNHTLRHLTALESSLINNTMMVQIAVLAWIFLGESVTAREGFGLALAMLGALLVQLAGPAPGSARSENQLDSPARPAEPTRS